jgi:hypothetical protein
MDSCGHALPPGHLPAGGINLMLVVCFPRIVVNVRQL